MTTGLTVTPTVKSNINKYEFYIVATVVGTATNTLVFSSRRTLVVGCMASDITITHHFDIS